MLHTGSTDPRRFWPAERFAKVGDFLAEELGLKVALTGTRIDAAQIERVMEQMHAPCVNLRDQLSLSGLTGLLTKARMVISNDTGPLHMALALGRPVVGLFWVESVITPAAVPPALYAPDRLGPALPTMRPSDYQTRDRSSAGTRLHARGVVRHFDLHGRGNRGGEAAVRIRINSRGKRWRSPPFTPAV